MNAAYNQAHRVSRSSPATPAAALIKQIEQGAPAEVFISADLELMDYGAQKKVIQDRHTCQSAGQQAGADRAGGFQDCRDQDRAGFRSRRLAGDGRIATGDVSAVPVGRYAKAALEKLGLVGNGASRSSRWWRMCASRWPLVARGEAPLGIVYETDAEAEPESQDHRHLPGRIRIRRSSIRRR